MARASMCANSASLYFRVCSIKVGRSEVLSEALDDLCMKCHGEALSEAWAVSIGVPLVWMTLT